MGLGKGDPNGEVKKNTKKLYLILSFGSGGPH